MATHSSILAWRNRVDRGAWWTTVHAVARVRHDLATKQQQIKTVKWVCKPTAPWPRSSTMRINWNYHPPPEGKGQDLGINIDWCFFGHTRKASVDSKTYPRSRAKELGVFRFPFSDIRTFTMIAHCLKMEGLMKEHRSHSMGPRPILDYVRAGRNFCNSMNPFWINHLPYFRCFTLITSFNS